MKEYSKILDVVLKNVPDRYLDDARQAGILGILCGAKKNNSTPYLYRCALNEIIKEVALMHRPFSLNKDIFCKLIKYRRRIKDGLSIRGVSDVAQLEELDKIVSF